MITVGLVQGPQVLHEELGREPTASEVLEYVADEVESKSPTRRILWSDLAKSSRAQPDQAHGGVRRWRHLLGPRSRCSQ